MKVHKHAASATGVSKSSKKERERGREVLNFQTGAATS